MKPENLRRIFLILFVTSTVFVFLLGFGARGSFIGMSGTETPGVSPTAKPGDTPEHPSPAPSKTVDSSVMIGSIITSVTSLIGFVTTTVITWRKEKRDASLADVERRRLETELEKSRLELEELRKARGKKDGRKKK